MNTPFERGTFIGLLRVATSWGSMSGEFATGGPPFHGGRDLFLSRVFEPLAPYLLRADRGSARCPNPVQPAESFTRRVYVNTALR